MMKLRNKKTGYVANWCIDKDVIRTCDGSIVYNSLAELNADWEDYIPKAYWAVDWSCTDGVSMFNDRDDDIDEFNKSIGNYFETKEEAEKVIEKLKALKRLKDKGFSFGDWNWKTQCIEFDFDNPDITEEQVEEANKDLDSLFGGGE